MVISVGSLNLQDIVEYQASGSICGIDAIGDTVVVAVEIQAIRNPVAIGVGVDHPVRVDIRVDHGVGVVVRRVGSTWECGGSGIVAVSACRHIRRWGVIAPAVVVGARAVADVLEGAIAAPAVEPVAAALDHAHGQGVIHRDIKPENILFSEGLAVVADFGIARMESSNLTVDGQFIGTPNFMSPEQAAGDNPKIGPSSASARAEPGIRSR